MHQYNNIVVPDEWLATQGEGSIVGICDTWIDVTHPQISDNIIGVKSFAEKRDETKVRHATHVAGIITQLAPKCKIYISIITNSKSGSLKSFEKGLKWLEDKNLDVLNLSLACSHSDTIYGSIKKIHNNNCIITAPSIVDKYPSGYSEVVSVSSFGTENPGDVYAPYSVVSSVPGNRVDAMSGYSMSSAYYAGVCACKQAYKKGSDVLNVNINEGGYIVYQNINSLYKSVFI